MEGGGAPLPGVRTRGRRVTFLPHESYWGPPARLAVRDAGRERKQKYSACACAQVPQGLLHGKEFGGAVGHC